MSIECYQARTFEPREKFLAKNHPRLFSAAIKPTVPRRSDHLDTRAVHRNVNYTGH